MSNQTVVTGAGVLTSVGRGIEALSAALRSGRSGITYSTADELGVAGRLPSLDFEQNLAELRLPDPLKGRALRAGRRAPRSAQAGLISTLEAWGRAFGQTAAYAPDEVNIILAGSNLNQGYQRGVMGKFAEDPEYVPASYALHYLDTDQIGLISEVLGIRGEGFSVGGASASGNMALLQAHRQIKAGLCKACVVVGAMADLSPVELRAFQHAGALGGRRFVEQPERASRPFDTDRDGFIYGQGAACLILEAEGDARLRNADIWGVVAGGAACLDGNRSSDPSVAGEVRAMRAALVDAGIGAGEVEYLNAHGTSSRLGDEVEVAAIKEVFGPGIGGVSVNSTKSIVGHCLYAAGAVEAVATILQLKEGFIHPNLNLESPIDGACRFIRLTAEERRCEVALSNSFGFGGISTSMVFRRHS